MQPKMSVVMNSYKDRPKYLRQALRVHLNQVGVDSQVIVSTVEGDSAIEIAESMGAEVVVNKKPGLYTQLNAALSRVTGDWYCYSSGNDVSMPHKCLYEIQTCKRRKGKVCFSSFYIANLKLVVNNEYVPKPYDYQRHLTGNFVIDSALMHRSILEKYKPFRTRWGNHAYWDFWLRVFEGEGNVFVRNLRPTKIRRIDPQSRHQRRKRDPVARAENDRLRKAMLAWHRRIRK